MKKYQITESPIGLVEESFVKYNSDKDFTTLDAWRKARLVKVFLKKELL